MKEQLVGAITFSGKCGDALCMAMFQVGFGVAMKMNRNLRNFMLENMVRVAEVSGKDDTKDLAILMKFVSRPNRELLRTRIDSALARNGKEGI